MVLTFRIARTPYSEGEESKGVSSEPSPSCPAISAAFGLSATKADIEELLVEPSLAVSMAGQAKESKAGPIAGREGRKGEPPTGKSMVSGGVKSPRQNP